MKQENCSLSRFAGYYRTLIPQYSALTNRLNGIKRVDKFVWNKEIEQYFKELKKAFTEGGIQEFPDFKVWDPFILTTHWSKKENIPRVLSQVQDEQK